MACAAASSAARVRRLRALVGWVIVLGVSGGPPFGADRR
jgi:hypothetical protein